MGLRSCGRGQNHSGNKLSGVSGSCLPLVPDRCQRCRSGHFFLLYEPGRKAGPPPKAKTAFPCSHRNICPVWIHLLYDTLRPSTNACSAPMVLVIDNYQLIPPESLLHALIRNGLSVIPDGLTMILISRESPPPTFSRMLANQKMTHIGWNQIRLTLAGNGWDCTPANRTINFRSNHPPAAQGCGRMGRRADADAGSGRP